MIAIAGPTAVGKTAIALGLARHFATEIISADSRQVYRQMSIGTAKPEPHELESVKHHFIDTLDISESFSAGEFERQALHAIQTIHESRDVVVMAGGTGLYHKAVLVGLDDFPQIPDSVKDKWQQHFENHGIEFLKEQLEKSDPQYFKNVDLNNHTRLIRALSVIDHTGNPFSEYRVQERKPRPFKAMRIFLNIDRPALYARINNRVDHMIEQGLVDEVKALLPYRHHQALQTVGYSEIFKYFDGEWSLEEAIDKIKQHTRNYAKRQVTWFRNQGDWLELEPNVQTVLQALKLR